MGRLAFIQFSGFLRFSIIYCLFALVSPLAVAPLDAAPNASPTAGYSLPVQFVTLAWDPSPDDSVIGYHLYVGTASQKYTAKLALGGQTSIRVLVNQPLMYFVITAYNSYGFESVSTNELVLASKILLNGGNPADTGDTGGSL